MAKDKATVEATSAGRVRPWPIIAGLLCIVLGLEAATQYFARAMGYQPALGEPLFHLGDAAVYPPHDWLMWLIKYRAYNHPALTAAFAVTDKIVIGSVFAAGIVAMFLRYILTRDLQKPTADLHGTADWMPREQVLESGLVNAGRGVYIGAYYDKKTKEVMYLRHDGPEHVEATAPTRSGKGVGLILPTLLSWPHSVVVHDIKGEAWALTAGYRQRELGQYVLRFDPSDPSGTSCGYNPIEEIRLGTIYEVADAMNVAAMIVDPDGKGMTDHWAKTGHELLSAGILHVLYAERNKTLRGLVSFFCDPSKTMEQVAQTMLLTEHDPNGEKGWLDPITDEPTTTHPMIAEAARSFLNKADNERSGVQSTAMSFLAIYRDPIVALNTQRSDFRITDLMNSDKPVSLYIVNKPSDKSRLRPLIRLLMSQIIRTNVREMKFAEGRSVASYKHKLLWLHDECSSTGKLEVLEDALPYMAGYGIKAYLIWQDREQKRAAFGQNESISGQTHVRLAFAPNTFETAEWLSKMLGTTTRIKSSVSYSGKRGKATLDQVSTQLTEVARPLLTPDEVMRLPAAKKDKSGNIEAAGDMLIMVTGQKPIYGRQILYFIDPVFDARSKIPPPEASDRLREPAAPVAPLPRPVLPTPPEQAQAAEGDDESAEWESPPLTDAALADYGEPDEHDSAAAAAMLVADPELELGAPIAVDLASLADLPDDEDETASAPVESAVHDSTAPQAAAPVATSTPASPMTLKDMLQASQRWAAGEGLDALQPLTTASLAEADGAHADVTGNASASTDQVPDHDTYSEDITSILDDLLGQHEAAP